MILPSLFLPPIGLLKCGGNLQHTDFSRYIYILLTIFLIEEESLLNDFLVERLRLDLITTAGLLRLEGNCSIAILAIDQKSWPERLLLGFELYGRRDTAGHEDILALPELHLVSSYERRTRQVYIFVKRVTHSLRALRARADE